MSRLTLGGRRRAGGKVQKHRRLLEEEHENVDTQTEDLLQTVDESHDRSSCAPKYTYYLKYLIVLRIFFSKRKFTPVSCCKCGEEFDC
jgi:formylmethanofuran dehydrogenase subunit E